ncbi:MAG: proline--tRNA ligase, partial [Dehalococcoidia bacterium]|nr:proline--tRNA ligase [Dehalococcoidia bacterium]
EIIRQEMDRSGAQEVHLPALQPREPWVQSGRDASMDAVLFRLNDRRERAFVLGPTHEEMVSLLAARHIQSYRDLPVTLYQIQTKFRDEARPRGGLIRVREFAMMDAYSFDSDWEALDQSYQLAYDAYFRIFERGGVPVIPVEADSGAIGGKDSQEFIFLTESGEDTILLCDSCGYAANAEKAEFRIPPAVASEPLAMERVHTPGQETIAELAKFLNIEGRQTAKAVFVMADGKPVFVVIRGDLEVNEVKLTNALKATNVRPMEDREVEAAGLVAGSASPVGISGIQVVADQSVVDATNLVAGANEVDWHLRNVNYGRDWTAALVADFSLARDGDRCARCSGTLHEQRGIEMGHVFKLGTMYAEALDVRFLDQAGQRNETVMGCYGIGVERMLAAVIEANHDKDGIIWPKDVAPFDVHIVALDLEELAVERTLTQLEEDCEKAGLSVLIDDRDDSPGIKFKDADLLGMPVRLTVGPRALAKGGVELRVRRTGEMEIVPADQVVARLKDV